MTVVEYKVVEASELSADLTRPDRIVIIRLSAQT